MSYKPDYGLSNRVAEDFVLSENVEESRKQIIDKCKELAYSSNSKTYGLFSSYELLNNERFLTDGSQKTKSVFRKVLVIGTVAQGATLNTAHGISGLTQIVRLYGSIVTDVVDYRPLPRVSATAVNEQVSLDLVGANIVLINGAAAPAITAGLIIIECLKES